MSAARVIFDELRISTHAPHTGSDSLGIDVDRLIKISTHAPHTGSDTRISRSHAKTRNFNSRSPYGER